MKNELIKQMGLRWTIYRLQYELKKKFGYLEKKYPYTTIDTIDFDEDLSIEKIKDEIRHNLSSLNSECSINSEDLKDLISRCEYIFHNKFRYFFNDYHEFKGWNYSPKTKKYAPLDIHWSKISDLDNDFGDIKWIWDLSRFTFAYDLVRAYIYTKDERYAKKYWELFENFNDKNKLELGPNYRCSQEMSFRANAWLFSLYMLIDSEHTSEQRIRTTIKLLSHYAEHIKKHINFSVEAVKNNHSISEASTLIVLSQTLPFLPNADSYKKLGEKVLIKEIDWQIKKDGSYIQHSHNYHRLVMQNLSWVLTSYKSIQSKPPKSIVKKAKKSIEFFKTIISDSGDVPNYGMNDGSYIFPLTERGYLDYRPMLQNINFQVNHSLLFDSEVNELVHLMNKNLNFESKYSTFKINKKIVSFKQGGYYISTLGDFKTILKSKTYEERPNQADANHLDIWYKDKNIFKDAGTYSYNDVEESLNYFNGTKSHNTVLIDNMNQMIKGGRFIWYKWTKTKLLNITEKPNHTIIESKILNYDDFQHLRRVFTYNNSVVVEDEIINENGKSIEFNLQWLTEEKVDIDGDSIRLLKSNIDMKFEANTSYSIHLYYADETNFRGWVSETYGEKHGAYQIVLSGKSDKKKINIKTIIHEI